MTYTVAVLDRTRGEIALGTVSHSSAVFTKVFTRASGSHGTALVASQAFSSPELGRRCAELAASGADRPALTQACVSAEWAGYRQVLAVSTEGVLFAHTGGSCLGWAGHEIDEETGVVAAGNMLRDDRVLAAAMAAAGDLGDPVEQRVLAGLAAAGAAGGDVRGDRAAGLHVQTGERRYDVRVDDHDDPHAELRRLEALERGRGSLAACYSWIARGRPDAEVDALLELLASGAGDRDVATWHGTVRILSGRSDGTASVHAHRLAERVLAPGSMA